MLTGKLALHYRLRILFIFGVTITLIFFKFFNTATTAEKISEPA